MEKNNTEIRTLRIEKTLNAPLEFVWKVWTNAEHIENWWGPNGFTTTIHRMEVKAGAEWLLTMHGPDGKNYPNRSIYREVIPLKKIVYEHFNPGFIATVTFEPKDGKTYMEWAMLFETKELFDVVVTTFKADDGIKQNVEKLTSYLEKK